MNKSNLVAEIVNNTNLTKKDAKAALDVTFTAIQNYLAQGEKVIIKGFGTFEVKDRKQRNGFNPKTGIPIIIPAHKSAKFTVGTTLKKAVK